MSIVGNPVEPEVSVPERARRANFTAVTLGWLCLIPVFLVIVAQSVALGYSMTLGSTVPLSDSNIWASCASALAGGDESYNLAWCLRRPLTIVAQSPLFLLAPKSMAAVVLIQLLVVCVALWWFLVAVARSMPVGRIGILLVYALSLWPVLSYGTYLGPEAQTLWLSFVSAAAVLTYLRTRRIGWGILGGSTAILAFQIRPGNAVVTATLAIGVVVLTWRRDRRVLAALGIAVVFLGMWLLPPRIMAVAGWAQAGHAANFWATAYSAATPEDDGWEAAYERFAPEVGCPGPAEWTADPCLALESEKFGQLLRDQAITQMRANPKAIVRQMVVNLRVLASDGYLNQMWATPFAPAWQIWNTADRAVLFDGWDGLYAAGATLVWVASWVLLALLCLGLFRLRRLRGPPIEGSQSDVDRDQQPRTIAYVLALGLIAIFGATATFALIGHDEPQRHLVQNIPFILAAIAGLASLPWRKGARTLPGSAPWRRSPKWVAILISGVVGALVLGAGSEGRLPTQSLQVSRSCEAGAAAQTYEVVGTASVGSELGIGSPDDWRKLGNPDISLLFSGQSYYVQQNLDRLPPGTVLDLRSKVTGEVIPVFVSDEVLSVHPFDGGGFWCTRTPSKYGVMLVHDLVPLN